MPNRRSRSWIFGLSLSRGCLHPSHAPPLSPNSVRLQVRVGFRTRMHLTGPRRPHLRPTKWHFLSDCDKPCARSPSIDFSERCRMAEGVVVKCYLLLRERHGLAPSVGLLHGALEHADGLAEASDLGVALLPPVVEGVQDPGAVGLDAPEVLVLGVEVALPVGLLLVVGVDFVVGRRDRLLEVGLLVDEVLLQSLRRSELLLETRLRLDVPPG